MSRMPEGAAANEAAPGKESGRRASRSAQASRAAEMERLRHRSPLQRMALALGQRRLEMLALRKAGADKG